MRVKLDENLGNRGAQAFRAAGHDVATAYEQGLTGATDDELYDVCVRESRLLVSLDLDFANPLRFDPAKSAGIAVLRVNGERHLDERGTSFRAVVHRKRELRSARREPVARGEVQL